MLSRAVTQWTRFGDSRRRIRRVCGVAVDRVLWSIAGGSSRFWDLHYRAGGTSGPGSVGELRSYKATFLNNFVAQHSVSRVVEFGCGNGDQLEEASYPEYVGLDISEAVVQRAIRRYRGDSSKSFFIYSPRGFVDNCGVFRAELTLSLDVIFHLVEDAIYHRYLEHLFAASTRWVIVYSSNMDVATTNVRYTRHRRFIDDVAKFDGWRLVLRERNPLSHATNSQFFVFERVAVNTEGA